MGRKKAIKNPEKNDVAQSFSDVVFMKHFHNDVSEIWLKSTGKIPNHQFCVCMKVFYQHNDNQVTRYIYSRIALDKAQRIIFPLPNFKKAFWKKLSIAFTTAPVLWGTFLVVYDLLRTEVISSDEIKALNMNDPKIFREDLMKIAHRYQIVTFKHLWFGMGCNLKVDEFMSYPVFKENFKDVFVSSSKNRNNRFIFNLAKVAKVFKRVVGKKNCFAEDYRLVYNGIDMDLKKVNRGPLKHPKTYRPPETKDSSGISFERMTLTLPPSMLQRWSSMDVVRTALQNRKIDNTPDTVRVDDCASKFNEFLSEEKDQEELPASPLPIELSDKSKFFRVQLVDSTDQNCGRISDFYNDNSSVRVERSSNGEHVSGRKVKKICVDEKHIEPVQMTASLNVEEKENKADNTTELLDDLSNLASPSQIGSDVLDTVECMLQRIEESVMSPCEESNEMDVLSDDTLVSEITMDENEVDESNEGEEIDKNKAEENEKNEGEENEKNEEEKNEEAVEEKNVVEELPQEKMDATQNVEKTQEAPTINVSPKRKSKFSKARDESKNEARETSLKRKIDDEVQAEKRARIEENIQHDVSSTDILPSLNFEEYANNTTIGPPLPSFDGLMSSWNIQPDGNEAGK